MSPSPSTPVAHNCSQFSTPTLVGNSVQLTPLKDQAGSLRSTQPTDQPRVQTLRPTVQRLLALTRHKRRARQADRWPELARTPAGLCYAAFHGVSWRRQAVDRLFGVRKSSSQQTGQLRQRLHSGSLCPSPTTLRCWIRQSIRPSTQLSAASNRYSHPAARSQQSTPARCCHRASNRPAAPTAYPSPPPTGSSAWLTMISPGRDLPI